MAITYCLKNNNKSDYNIKLKIIKTNHMILFSHHFTLKVLK